MNRAKFLRLFAVAFLLGLHPSARAQNPLKIEIFAGNYRNWDPVRVHVQNITDTEITLVIPVNINSKNERTKFSLPLDVERLDGDEWKLCWPVQGARRGYGSLDIKSGDSRVYTFGIASDGRYRARVWYIAAQVISARRSACPFLKVSFQNRSTSWLTNSSPPLLNLRWPR